jgi:uncharacterized DUF497 family protein
MRITFDAAKREITLAERGLDFADAALVFSGVTLEVEDTRKNYGEPRIICYGLLGGADGCRGLHAAWRGSPRLQHEESQ